MQFVAGLLAGWVLVYLAFGGYLIRRWFVEGRQRVYLVLAGASLALAAYTVGSVVYHLADTPEAGNACTRLQTALATGGVAPMLFSFALDFAGRRGRWVEIVRWTVGGVGLALGALIAAGLAFDPQRPIALRFALGGVEGTYHDFAPTPLVAVFALFDVGAILASTVVVARAAVRQRVGAAPVAVGFVLFLAATINDALVINGAYDFLYLGEHLYMLLVGSFGYVLFERSARLAVELRERTAQLEATHHALEATHADLRRSYDSLDAAQRELHESERLADLGRMAASLAHEIRNPLCVLSNVSAGLRRELDRAGAPADLRTLLDALRDEVEHLERLVNDLLAFARPDRRSRTRASLAMVADQAILAVVSALPDPGRYEVRRAYDDPPPKAMIDLERVRQALVNLLLNACQSMPDGGPLTVFVGRGDRPGEARIGVRDAGGGIAAENRERIFEPFFSTKPTGTGLGLSIVRAIAEDHDGRVEVESAPGAGSTFWIHLGLGAAAADEAGGPRAGREAAG